MQPSELPTNGQATTETCEEQVVDGSNECYDLRLFIAGLSPRSTLAVERVLAICDRYLPGRYKLTIIDLYVQPEEARRAQIVVVPTLVVQVPSPMRLFIGDMADEKRILQGLNIAS